ncbi:sulfotransferase [Nocardioides sp.]|uniref:sulfotransferase n=1 Tax=Nocardioides sp. TaxID=35761 RepID=UPI001A323B28|nr:sulfotransferase [Nocardioides sp.]MBJ7358465.1 sulfotransferase [Nocardioides sp.]
MTLPDFVCVGAQKAATSWLAQVLQEHPQVWVPPIGEPHFFDRVGRPLRRRVAVLAERARRESDEPSMADYLDRIQRHPAVSLDWYQELFTDPRRSGTRGGDVTPAYLGMDEERVRSARELLGDVPVLVVVRRPLDRELSQLRMWATRTAGGLTPPTTEEEWAARYELMTRRAPRGRYGASLPRWQAHFSRVLALPFGDVREQPEDLIARVEDHVGVDRYAGYTRLRTTIHRSARAEIPPSVVARAEANVADDDRYLTEELGTDFFARTR